MNTINKNVEELLPISHCSAVLEDRSKDKLKQCFPRSLFVLRWENDTDVGVDGSIEVIHLGRYTNLRSHFQLKATANCKQNRDGTYSHSIPTSNLNYMKTDSAGLYFFYIEKTDTMLFSWVSDIVTSLENKSSKWTSQQKNTVHFHNLLDVSARKLISTRITQCGRLMQGLNDSIRLANTPEIVVRIDPTDLTMTTSAETMSFLSKHGLTAINSGFAHEVIEISNLLSFNQSSTIKIQLVRAFALSNLGDKYGARHALQRVLLNSEPLSDGEKAFLTKLDTAICVSFGEVSVENYIEQIGRNLDPGKEEYLEYRIEKLLNLALGENEAHILEDYQKEIIKLQSRIQESDIFSANFKLDARCKVLEVIIHCVCVKQIEREYLYQLNLKRTGTKPFVDTSIFEQDLKADFHSFLAEANNIFQEAILFKNELLVADTSLKVYKASLWGITHYVLSMTTRDSTSDLESITQYAQDIGKALEEPLEIFRRKNSIRGEIETLALQITAYELVASRDLELYKAKKLMKLASAFHYKEKIEFAQQHINGVNTDFSKGISVAKESVGKDPDINWANATDNDIDRFSNEMMRIKGYSSDRLKEVRKENLFNRMGAKARLYWCRHIFFLHDNTHLEQMDSAYSNPINRVCICKSKHIESIPSHDNTEDMLTNFKQQHCFDCLIREPKIRG